MNTLPQIDHSRLFPGSAGSKLRFLQPAKPAANPVFKPVEGAGANFVQIFNDQKRDSNVKDLEAHRLRNRFA